MILRVNPNRMELIRLRRRLALAQRGHKLLEDKLEGMMRKFLGFLKDMEQAKEDFKMRTEKTLKDLLYCRIVSPQENFKDSLSQISVKLILKIYLLRIMNVKVPVLSMEELKIDKHYDFFRTSAQLDVVIRGAQDYIRSLLKLAELLRTLDILSGEIERTRRRVNALEYILIPSIHSTIHYISDKLNEFERANIIRLMRIKELIRRH